MIALTKSRKVLFKKNNQVYPGLKSITGSWDEFSTSGLCTFNGTVEIANIYENPSTVDNRQNQIGWIFGTEIEILVEDDNANFVRPKLLPKLYIKNSEPYNPETRILTLQVSCVLGLLSEYSLDHWKNPEKDAENPDDEPEIEQWWDEWEKKGETTVSAIINKIFNELEITLNSGQVLPSTKIILPWNPSGSLIAACGDLCFKSTFPSILYSDENGNINIHRINVENPVQDLYVKIGVHEKYYQPTGNDTPLSELIISGEIPEIIENVDELINEENGFCTYREEEGADYALGLNTGNYLILATEETCEYINKTTDKMIKTVITKRHERVGLLFPDITNRPKTDMVKSLEKIHRQYFDLLNENRLVFEETILKEPWGKIFGGWYGNHLDWYVTTAPSSTSEGGSISAFADEARYSTAIYESRKEEKNYIYNEKEKTLRKTENIVWEPVSKILQSFNGDGLASGFNYNKVITEKNYEEWVRYRKNERHTKTTRITMESKYSSNVENADTYLKEKFIKETGNSQSATIPIQAFVRNSDDTINIINKNVDRNFFLASQRLALVSDSDNENQELSRTGEASPPATENIPNNENKNQNEIEPEYKNKVFVERFEWDFPYPNKYKPPREFTSLGVLPNRTILKKISKILYFMRQGKSFSYEIVLPLNQYWIQTDFRPLQRIDVDEPEIGLIYIGTGFTIELRETESLVLSQLYWLAFV